MATTRPFAYNTGTTIDGTIQVGNIAIGVSDQDYSQDPGGVKWWMGPDEELGYVIVNDVPTGDHPTQVEVDAYLNFWRSKELTDQSLIDLLNSIPITNGLPLFTNIVDVLNWLQTNEYFTSYGNNLPTPTPTPIPNFLINLESMASYLTNYMSDYRNPDFYEYELDGNGFEIDDGGNESDMYDGGNITSPWLLSNVTYTGTSSYDSEDYPYAIDYQTTETTDTIDTSFRYISLGYESPNLLPLTVIGTRQDVGTPIGFQCGGNIGADGNGTFVEGNIYTGNTVSGFTVHSYYSETYDTGDPSVCDVFILLGHPNWDSVFGGVFYGGDSSNSGCGSFLYTSGNDTNNILAIKTLLSKENGVEVTFSEVNTVVDNFISRVYGLVNNIPVPSRTPTPTPTITPTPSPTDTPTPTPTPEPLDFTLSTDCISNGRLILSGFVGGGGEYDRTSSYFATESEALNAAIWSQLANAEVFASNTIGSDGTYWVAIRDRNNTSNKIAKSQTIICSTEPTQTPTPTPTPTIISTPQPLDFTLDIDCVSNGRMILSGFVGGSGDYDKTSNYYTTESEALNASIWSQLANAEVFSPIIIGVDGTYWVGIRDRNNLSDKVVKSQTIICNGTPTPTPTATPTPTPTLIGSPTHTPTPTPNISTLYTIDVSQSDLDDATGSGINNNRIRVRYTDDNNSNIITYYTLSGTYTNEICVKAGSAVEILYYKNGIPKTGLSSSTNTFITCGVTPTPTPTPTSVPTETPTPTPTSVPTETPTPTPTLIPNTFNVTNDGSSNYIINGQSNPSLSLTEGQTYTFNINASGHPFWIKTVNSTGDGNSYNVGVTNNGTANGTITFTVPYNSPSTLYYNCQFHSSMAGIINVTDVPSTATPSPTLTSTPTPTPTGSGAGSWYFYYSEGGFGGPPISNGNALFMTNANNSTYNPNFSEGTNQIYLNRYDSNGTDYSTQFNNLFTSGGSITMTQNGQTATYTGVPYSFQYSDSNGFLYIPNTVTQTAFTVAPFVNGNPITLSFS